MTTWFRFPIFNAIIINNTTRIGEAIAMGVCDYYGVKLPEEAKKTNASAEAKTLYTVQTGAFTVKKNAEAHLKALKKAGFEGVIKKSD